MLNIQPLHCRMPPDLKIQYSALQICIECGNIQRPSICVLMRATKRNDYSNPAHATATDGRSWRRTRLSTWRSSRFAKWLKFQSHLSDVSPVANPDKHARVSCSLVPYCASDSPLVISCTANRLGSPRQESAWCLGLGGARQATLWSSRSTPLTDY